MDDPKDAMYETSHAVWDFLASLDEAGLKAVDNLIVASTQGTPTPTASYYDGIIESLLWQKYGVCPTCSAQHDPEDHTAFNEAVERRMAAVMGANAMAQPTQARKPPTTQSVHTGTYL